MVLKEIGEEITQLFKAGPTKTGRWQKCPSCGEIIYEPATRCKCGQEIKWEGK